MQTNSRLHEQLLKARGNVLKLAKANACAVANRKNLGAIWDIFEIPEALTGLEDFYAWSRRTSDQVLALAAPVLYSVSPTLVSVESNLRYLCPLCQEAGNLQTGPLMGLSLPQMEDHLHFGQPPVASCLVMESLRWLTLEQNRDALQSEQNAEQIRRQEHRREKEVRFRATPYDRARLVGEGHTRWRTPEGLSWAIERLKALEFKVSCEDQVCTITREWGELILYADPTWEGSIPVRGFVKNSGKSQADQRLRIFLDDSLDARLPEEFKTQLRARIDIAASRSRGVSNF